MSIERKALKCPICGSTYLVDDVDKLSCLARNMYGEECKGTLPNRRATDKVFPKREDIEKAKKIRDWVGND